MSDEDPGSERRDEEPQIPDRSFENKKLSIYVAVALMGCLILLVVFVNVPGIRASAGNTMTMTEWQLQSFADSSGVLTPALLGYPVTVRFTPDGTVFGFSGCNQYSAMYTTKDYSITITPPVQTHLSCNDPGLMAQEGTYLADLGNSTEFRLTDPGLKMYGHNGLPLLVFIPRT
jgi:heat shock protein HslJ